MLNRKSKYPLYIILLLVAFGLIFVVPDFLKYLLVTGVIYAILALSLDIVVGGMGQFCFGQQAFFGIGAYISAIFSLHVQTPWAVWLTTFLLAPLAAAAVGFLIGYVAFQRTRGMFFSIVTFSFGFVIYTVINTWGPVTGGSFGLAHLPAPNLFGLHISSPTSYYIMMLVILIGVVYFLDRFWASKTGRAIISLKENEKLAALSGIRPLQHYVIGFVVSAGLAGLAGATFSFFLRSITPAIVSSNVMFTLIVMVFIGGTGTLWGPILGAILFTVLPDYLPIQSNLQIVVFAILMLICLIFLPRGLYPGLVSIINRWTKKTRKSNVKLIKVKEE